MKLHETLQKSSEQFGDSVIQEESKLGGTVRIRVSDGSEADISVNLGKDLTSAFESGEFSASVADGTFRNICPGDYITREVSVPEATSVGGGAHTIKFIIADLDSALDHGVTEHHVVIVPETPFFDAPMNLNSTNVGGYAGSYMQSTVMPAFANMLSAAFGASHLLRFKVDDQSCTCRLMTYSMVFGMSQPDFKKDNFLAGKQFAAFRRKPDLRGKGIGPYWLSDVALGSSENFAFVNSNTHCVFWGSSEASQAIGVRPFALLV